jgi:uncharacterized protein YecE (DUF72 family)
LDATCRGLRWRRAVRARGQSGWRVVRGAAADGPRRTAAGEPRPLDLGRLLAAIPDEPTIDAWIEATPPSFRFCPKVPKAISHALGAAHAGETTRIFVNHMRRLGERLGPALLQLPETFTPAGLRLLDEQLARFPDGFAVAVEVRHAARFAGGALRDELAALLERRGAAAVITDVAGRRDACHGSLTAPLAFIRWVGEEGHATDRPRIEGWIDRLADWRTRGLKAAYFIVHQPDDLVAPEGMALAAGHARARAGSTYFVAVDDGDAHRLRVVRAHALLDRPGDFPIDDNHSRRKAIDIALIGH